MIPVGPLSLSPLFAKMNTRWTVGIVLIRSLKFKRPVGLGCVLSELSFGKRLRICFRYTIQSASVLIGRCVAVASLRRTALAQNEERSRNDLYVLYLGCW